MKIVSRPSFPFTEIELDKEFKVIGIDSRGQGKATLGEQALTYEQIQKDVERVLEHLNIDTLEHHRF